MHRPLRSGLLVALGLAALIHPATSRSASAQAPSSAPAVGGAPLVEVVQAHLAWIAAHNNYRAKVVNQQDGETTEGTLVVDYLSGRILYTGGVQHLPPGVMLKTTNLRDGGFKMALSRGLERGDDLTVFLARGVPGPFPNGSWQLFERGATLNETIARLHTVASGIATLPASDQGAMGLRLDFDESLLEQLGRQLDRGFGMEDEVRAKRLGWLELWFGPDGRLVGGRVYEKNGTLISDGTLTYEEVDAPTAAVAAVMPSGEATAAELAALPPPAAAAPLERIGLAAEPILSSRWLVVGALGLLGICGVIVWRLLKGRSA